MINKRIVSFLLVAFAMTFPFSIYSVGAESYPTCSITIDGNVHDAEGGMESFATPSGHEACETYGDLFGFVDPDNNPSITGASSRVVENGGVYRISFPASIIDLHVTVIPKKKVETTPKEVVQPTPKPKEEKTKEKSNNQTNPSPSSSESSSSPSSKPSTGSSSQVSSSPSNSSGGSKIGASNNHSVNSSGKSSSSNNDEKIDSSSSDDQAASNKAEKKSSNNESTEKESNETSSDTEREERGKEDSVGVEKEEKKENNYLEKVDKEIRASGEEMFLATIEEYPNNSGNDEEGEEEKEGAVFISDTGLSNGAKTGIALGIIILIGGVGYSAYRFIPSIRQKTKSIVSKGNG